MRAEQVRAFAFRFISELGIRYRDSPAVTEGTPSLQAGPHAGDRLPDADLTVNDRATSLQRELAGPRLRLVLCGRVDAWSMQADAVATLAGRRGGIITVHRLTRSPVADALADRDGGALARLGIRDAGQYLVRPDGYVAYRCAGTDLTGVERYLDRWFPARTRGTTT
jgi:hypothetical protein